MFLSKLIDLMHISKVNSSNFLIVNNLDFYRVRLIFHDQMFENFKGCLIAVYRSLILYISEVYNEVFFEGAPPVTELCYHLSQPLNLPAK